MGDEKSALKKRTEGLPKLAERRSAGGHFGGYSRQRDVKAVEGLFGVYEGVALFGYRTVFYDADTYRAHSVVSEIRRFNVEANVSVHGVTSFSGILSYWGK